MENGKTILLLRHAKADRPHGIADFDRPLEEKGEKDAGRIGAFLKLNEIIPDIIAASKSKRTLDTAKIIADKLGLPKQKIAADATLYSADAADILNFIDNIDEALRNVLIVGHNPAFEDCASLLCNGGRLEMPTASIACFGTSEGSWREFRNNSALKFLLSPKLVKKLADLESQPSHRKTMFCLAGTERT